jgi:hypothetical protein
MLTFQVDGTDVVEVNFDAEGRDQLLRILTRLVPGDHEHLFTPSWGAGPLTEDFPNPDLSPVHKLSFQWIDDPVPVT